MKSFVVPLLCLALAGGAMIAALRSGPDVIQTFPDAARRPPLDVVLRDAISRNANIRRIAVDYLGYYRSEAAYQGLLKALEDPNVLVRLRALRGLRIRNDRRAIPVIERVIERDTQQIVRVKAGMCLQMLKDPMGREPVSVSY